MFINAQIFLGVNSFPPVVKREQFFKQAQLPDGFDAPGFQDRERRLLGVIYVQEHAFFNPA